MLPVIFKVFQDDLIRLAVGPLSIDSVDRMEQELLRGELVISMCEKTKVNQPFSVQFEFIGTFFVTKNLDNLLRLPASQILQRLQENIPWLLSRKAMLAPQSRVLKIIGRLAFCFRTWSGVNDLILLLRSHGSLHVVSLSNHDLPLNGGRLQSPLR